MGDTPETKKKCLCDPYPTLPHDLKMVLWFKSYSSFSTKLVLKPQWVDQGKKIKIWGSFISFIYRHKIENQTYRIKAKNDIEITQNGIHSPRETLGGHT